MGSDPRPRGGLFAALAALTVLSSVACSSRAPARDTEARRPDPDPPPAQPVAPATGPEGLTWTTRPPERRIHRLADRGGGFYYGRSLALSADGRVLALATIGAIEIWERGSLGAELALVASFDSPGEQTLAMTPDGTRVAAQPHTSRRHAFEIYHRSAAGWRLEARIVPPDRADTFGGVALSDAGDVVLAGAHVLTRRGAQWTVRRRADASERRGRRLVAITPDGALGAECVPLPLPRPTIPALAQVSVFTVAQPVRELAVTNVRGTCGGLLVSGDGSTLAVGIDLEIGADPELVTFRREGRRLIEIERRSLAPLDWVWGISGSQGSLVVAHSLRTVCVLDTAGEAASFVVTCGASGAGDTRLAGRSIEAAALARGGAAFAVRPADGVVAVVDLSDPTP
jgi:hypothetical protein